MVSPDAIQVKTKPKLEAPCEICGKVIRASNKSGLNLGMTAHMKKHKPVQQIIVDKIPPQKMEALALDPDMTAILSHPLVRGILSKVGTLETTVAQLTENNNKMTEAMSALVKSNNAMQEELTPIVERVRQAQQPQQQSPNQSILGFSLSPDIQKTIAEGLINKFFGSKGDNQFNPEAFKKQAEMLDSLARAIEGPKLRAMEELTKTLKLYTSAGLTTEKAIEATHANITARLAPEGEAK